MLEKTSQEFRIIFLMEFTKQLIKNSAPEELWNLKEAMQEENKRKEIIMKIKKRSQEIKPLISRQSSQIKINPSPVLTIPGQRFPSWLNSVRPVPANIEIDLGKLNSFVNDPMIREIICNGPGENILVKTSNVKPTNLFLSKEEIEKIIDIFAIQSKIPIQSGVYQVVVGNLMLYAIISEVVTSKFIIRKIFGEKRY